MMNDSQSAAGHNHLYFIARVLAVLLLFPLVPVLILSVVTPLTISGILYLMGTILVVVGYWRVAWKRANYRAVLLLGLGHIVVVAIVRIILIGNATKIKMVTLPNDKPQCWLNCILDEQDVALISTRVLSLTGGISHTEQDGLLDAMTADYQTMAQTQFLVASPFARTYLQQQQPAAFDAIVIEPENGLPSETGTIFLHGFTGNFTMPCWIFARAVDALKGITICPSVGWRGDWWTANGEATLRASIDYLHQQHVSRIYLAGLSNGAVGASELAYKLNTQINGLILVNGASSDAKIPELPVLVLAGSYDERMPADMMRSYADRLGSQATFVEFQADHFMLVKDFTEVRAAISNWLRKH